MLVLLGALFAVFACLLTLQIRLWAGEYMTTHVRIRFQNQRTGFLFATLILAFATLMYGIAVARGWFIPMG